MIVSDHAVNHFVAAMQATGNQHGKRQLRDKLACHNVVFRAGVVKIEQIRRVGVRMTIHCANGESGHPRGVECIFVKQADFDAKAVRLDVVVAVVFGVDQVVGIVNSWNDFLCNTSSCPMLISFL